MFLPISFYQASLRWHYPNQVLGRRSHLPLSLYTSSRLFSCDYIIHVFPHLVKGCVDELFKLCGLNLKGEKVLGGFAPDGEVVSAAREHNYRGLWQAIVV